MVFNSMKTLDWGRPIKSTQDCQVFLHPFSMAPGGGQVLQCNILLPDCKRMKRGETMARPLPIEYPGAVYHVTSRGNARNKVFNDDPDRTKFLKVFGTVLQNQRWLCHARGEGLPRPLSAAVVAEKRSRRNSQVATNCLSAAVGGPFSRFGGTARRRQGGPRRLGLYPLLSHK